MCECCSFISFCFFFGHLLNTIQIQHYVCVHVTLFIWNTRFGLCMCLSLSVCVFVFAYRIHNGNERLKIMKLTKWNDILLNKNKTTEKKRHHDNDSKRGAHAREQQKRPKTQSWITHRRNVYTFICLKYNDYDDHEQYTMRPSITSGHLTQTNLNSAKLLAVHNTTAIEPLYSICLALTRTLSLARSFCHSFACSIVCLLASSLAQSLVYSTF